MFVCPIPGADSPTVFWHAVIHYGLAAIVVTVGIVFIGLALVAYRADPPNPVPVRGDHPDPLERQRHGA